MMKNPLFPARAGPGEGGGVALALERMFSAGQAFPRKHRQGLEICDPKATRPLRITSYPQLLSRSGESGSTERW